MYIYIFFLNWDEMNQNLPLYLNLLKILTRYINSTNTHRIQRKKKSEVCRLWHFRDKKSDFLSNSIINTRKSGYLHMSILLAISLFIV